MRRIRLFVLNSLTDSWPTSLESVKSDCELPNSILKYFGSWCRALAHSPAVTANPSPKPVKYFLTHSCIRLKPAKSLMSLAMLLSA